MRPRAKYAVIYRHKPSKFREANEMIDRYIYFYSHERIQQKPEKCRWRDASPPKTQ